MSNKYSNRRLQSSSLTTVVSISLVLFMMGLLGLLILNTQKLSDHVKESIGFQIILNDDVKEVNVHKLQKTLDASDYVVSTKHVTKEEAAEQLQKDLGEEFVSFLGYNPLLSSIDVRLKAGYANTDSIAWIEEDLLENANIKEVIYQESLINLVNENLKKISLVILVFSGLLLLIALALINNTIRLAIYSKRFIINTMKLVGATHGFIRRPFIWKGIQHGVLGALIAIGLLIGVIFLAQKEIPELLQLIDEVLLATLFGIVIVLGIVISWISTNLAVRKYLRMNVDGLYY